eukprot:6089384-Amphidinium_carterae.1
MLDVVHHARQPIALPSHALRKPLFTKSDSTKVQFPSVTALFQAHASLCHGVRQRKEWKVSMQVNQDRAADDAIAQPSRGALQTCSARAVRRSMDAQSTARL